MQHLGLIAHGMADTLITPINDSLVDLDVLVVMEQSDLERISAGLNRDSPEDLDRRMWWH